MSNFSASLYYIYLCLQFSNLLVFFLGFSSILSCFSNLSLIRYVAFLPGSFGLFSLQCNVLKSKVEIKKVPGKGIWLSLPVVSKDLNSFFFLFICVPEV